MHSIDGKLDEYIAPVVNILRTEGINTFSSCEGGEGHCFEYPTVRISPRNPYDMRPEIAKIAAILSKHGYNGYYIKSVYSYQDKPSPWLPRQMNFIEIEFWQVMEVAIAIDFDADNNSGIKIPNLDASSVPPAYRISDTTSTLHLLSGK